MTATPNESAEDRARAFFATLEKAKATHGVRVTYFSGDKTSTSLLPEDKLPEALTWESLIDYRALDRTERRKIKSGRGMVKRFVKIVTDVLDTIDAIADSPVPVQDKHIATAPHKVTKAVRKRIAQLAKPLPPLQGKAMRAVKYERPGEAFIAGGTTEYKKTKGDQVITKPIRRDDTYTDAEPTMEPSKWDHRDKMEKCYRAGGWELVDKYIAEVHELAGTTPAPAPEPILIKIRKDGATATVASSDYIQAKTLDLQESGYSTLTTDEVAASVAKALTGAPAITVIDKFVADDIVQEGGAV